MLFLAYSLNYPLIIHSNCIHTTYQQAIYCNQDISTNYIYDNTMASSSLNWDQLIVRAKNHITSIAKYNNSNWLTTNEEKANNDCSQKKPKNPPCPPKYGQ